MKRELGVSSVDYTAEPKFDGLSVELLYEEESLPEAPREETGSPVKTSRSTCARYGRFPSN
jgi:hypothetical protein